MTTTLADSSTAELIASYLSAAGTITAVVLALFLQVFLVKLRRPSLTVDASTKEDGVERIGMRGHAGTVSCFLNVRVRAKSKRNAAKNVEAFLIEVLGPTVAGKRLPIPSASMFWTNTGQRISIDIPAGAWRNLDLLRYRGRVENPPQPEGLSVQLALPFKEPLHPRYLLNEAGKYNVIFELSADGVDPTFWRLSFDHVLVDVEREEDLLVKRVQNISCSRLKSIPASDKT